MPYFLYILASRLSDFYIDVSNNTDGSSALRCAYEPTPFSATEARTYSCPDGIGGRYVRVRFQSEKIEYLQLCEVQVQGISEYFIMDFDESFTKWLNAGISAK